VKHFIFLVVLFSVCASAQTFDVASVRIDKVGSAGGEGQAGESITSTPGSLIMHNVTLRSCVKWAYGIRDFQLSGGPDWIGAERYDISAKAANKADDAELRRMLRALLAERFQLAVREERRQLPVYALIVLRAKAGLKPASDGGPASMRPGDGALEFRNTSMAELAERLASRPLSVDRPVVDKTGLNGGFDFSLKFADNAEHLKGALEDVDRGAGPSLFSVIQDQLGLKLEAQKAELPVVVVERAVENPGEN
jgi:uncharacterized protein (TIGR03435 family)